MSEPRRTRVLVIGLGSEAYGRERRVVNVFRHAPGLEPHFLVSRWGDGSVAALLEQYAFPFEHASFGYFGRARLRDTATTLARLPELSRDVIGAYRRHGCESVLIASLNGFGNALPGVLALRAAGARVVFHLGDWIPQTWLYRAMAPLVTRVAHRIITNSDAARRDLVRLGVDADQVEVVYNGLRHEEYQGVVPADHRASYGWPDDAIVVGWAGRFSHAKGAWDLAHAAQRVTREVPRARFVMIGRTAHVDSCQDEIAAWIRTRELQAHLAFAGHVCDMPAAYAGLDLMVVPSRTETLPNVLLEAMASGLAVIASRTAGIPEVVRDGENGVLVPPGNVAELAGAIATLAKDRELRALLGARARDEARTRFDAHRNSARIERALQGLS